MPNGLAVGGFSSVNHPTVCMVMWLCACDGFKHAFWSVFWVQCTGGAFWRTRDNNLEGREWQEAYLLHFLAE
jgi:hypothetical protein